MYEVYITDHVVWISQSDMKYKVYIRTCLIACQRVIRAKKRGMPFKFSS